MGLHALSGPGTNHRGGVRRTRREGAFQRTGEPSHQGNGSASPRCRTNCRKINADLVEENSESWTLILRQRNSPSSARFETYKDHRMAMAFAPLVTLMDVDIENPSVVRKSYPNFWNDIASFGVPVSVKVNEIL
ncbi:MAG: hypothetical protein QM762_05620 [Chryseolinea sp.]